MDDESGDDGPGPGHERSTSVVRRSKTKVQRGRNTKLDLKICYFCCNCSLNVAQC